MERHSPSAVRDDAVASQKPKRRIVPTLLIANSDALPLVRSDTVTATFAVSTSVPANQGNSTVTNDEGQSDTGSETVEPFSDAEELKEIDPFYGFELWETRLQHALEQVNASDTSAGLSLNPRSSSDSLPTTTAARATMDATQLQRRLLSITVEMLWLDKQQHAVLSDELASAGSASLNSSLTLLDVQADKLAGEADCIAALLEKKFGVRGGGCVLYSDFHCEGRT